MLKLKRAILIAFLTSVALSGCEKKENEQVKDQAVQKVGVDELKRTLAKLVNVEVSQISYNEKTEMFLMFGKEQISLKDLTRYYEQSK